MKEVRNLKNTLTKRVRPALLAVILLFTMGFSGYAPKAATNQPVTVTDKNEQVKITKTVEATNDENRTFKVTVNVKNIFDWGYISDDYLKLKNVTVTEDVSSEFNIITDSYGDANLYGNTLTWNVGKLKQGRDVTFTYYIQAKSTTLGGQLYDVSTSSSKVGYDFYWSGHYPLWNYKEFGIPVAKVNVDKVAKPDEVHTNVALEKTARSLGNDKYEVTFNMQGHIPELNPSKADIIVLVDKSGSMKWNSAGKDGGYSNSRMKVIKDSVNDLANKVLNDSTLNKNGSIRMAIASFESDPHIETNFKGTHFSSNYNEIKKVVGTTESEGLKADGGTNTQAGILTVGKLLDESKNDRPGAKRYVVMFTDGMPTYCLTDKGSSTSSPDGGSSSPDIKFKKAQQAYNEIIGGIKTIGGIGYNSQEETLNPVPTGRHSDSKFYSVGFATEDKDKMVKFLKTTQNVIAADQFEAKYCAGSTSAITNIFTGITNDIKASISSIMNNPKIEDTITDEFKLSTSLGVNGKDLTVKVNDVAITDSVILNSIVKVDSTNAQKLTLDLSKVPQRADSNNNIKLTVSFVVEAIDPYYSNNGVETNLGDAKLSFVDPANGENITKTVKSPTVNIAPKQGSITIQKIVTGTDKADKFSVYLNRKNTGTGSLNDKAERYAMEFVGNDTKVMNFYLRGNITDVSKITNAVDEDKNYVTAGKFTASEIVPMDYENQSMQYSYDNIKWNELTSSTEFNIDKDHPNVYIRVTNNLVNDSYWRDRSDVSNTFNYTGK